MAIDWQKKGKSVASKIFTVFGSLAIGRVFSLPGTYNPVTETTTGGKTETVPAIRQEYKEFQFDGQQIKIGDFILLAEASKFSTITPSVSGLKVAVDGLHCQVVRAVPDPTDSVWTIQCRAM